MSLIGEIFRQLLTPLAYLRLRHRTKWVYDWGIPLGLAVAVTATCAYLDLRVPILAEPGLVPASNAVLQMLTGFFIASLAAVSTFQSEGIGKPLEGEPMLLKEKVNEQRVDSELNRRRFLCLLFGYLAFASFSVYILGATAQIVGDQLIANPDFDIVELDAARTVFLFCYIFLIGNLGTTTLLGLYYLSYQLHAPGPPKTAATAKAPAD